MKIDQKEELIPFFKKLREFAEQQQGLIQRTTCSSLNDPGEYIVMGEWESADQWIEGINL